MKFLGNKVLALWLVLAILVGGSLASFNVPRILSILFHESEEVGTVTNVICQEHNLIEYEFTTNDEIIFGKSRPPGDCLSVKAGDKIEIYFDSTNPKTSISLNPKGMLLNELIPIFLASIFIPSMILFVNIPLALNRRKSGGSLWWR